MPRPKSFDPEAALSKAMDVFWEKGYDAASITDLTAAMGINRFSLYDTFGDKRTLYLKALDFYSEQFVEPMVGKISMIDTMGGLGSLFDGLIEYQGSCSGKPCCMMQKASVSMAMGDAEARQRVEHARGRIHEAYQEALERVRRNGELRADLDLSETAWLVMIIQDGLLSSASSPIPTESAKSAVGILLGDLKAK